MKVKFVSIKIIYTIVLFLFLIVLFLGISIYVNRIQVYPTELEKKKLESFFNDQNLEDVKDIITVQNKVETAILHENTGEERLDILKTFALRGGQCFDRSLLLQKYFVLKGFRIRPVYLFWRTDGTTSIFDFFKKDINSHNVFEIYFQNKWYLIRTNHKMDHLESLDHYLNFGEVVPPHTRYIRYLNNRNGKFLYPNYLPDIYFF